MPQNSNRIIGQFLPGGSPAAVKTPINVLQDLYAAGQVGATFDLNGNTYTLVLVEPAVTTLLVGQVLYWKDTGNTGNTPTVTNILANAVGGATSALSQVAGISLVAFSTTGTLGTLIAIATGASKNIPVLSTGTFTIGQQVVAISTAGLVGPVVTTAALIPTVGVSRSAATTTAQPINVDLNLPTLP